MVTRKPIHDAPTVNPDAPPQVTLQNVRQELWSATDSETSTDRIWADVDAPQTSQVGPYGYSDTASLQRVPDTLRPGPPSRSPSRSPYDPAEDNPWEDVGKDSDIAAPVEPKSKLEHVPSVLRPGVRGETNPFKRKPLSTEGTGSNVANTPNISNSPARDPTAPPTESFSQLDLGPPEPSNNPWKLGTNDVKPDLISVTAQEGERNIWGSEVSSRQPSTGPAANSPALLSLPSDGESAAWDNSEPTKSSLPPMPHRSSEEQEFSQDAHAWDDVGALDKVKAPAATVQPEPAEGWNLIDYDSVPQPAPGTLSKASTWENLAEDQQPKGKEVAKETAKEARNEEQPPELPPRKSTDIPPPQPPRPQSPRTANKTETYQIKNISWFDASAAQNPRRSPILVQNVNGPCPLVALVNALTLTTPADITNTVLVETLRSREQISLNLLLEAVFDELMTRRTNKDVPLPDVTELYAFLKGLHTGMNVNPRFLPTPELEAAFKRTSLSHVHPTERGDHIPGTFEHTRDMKLYATFSIPLIHGWLPPRDEPVYEAFGRQASSYDDVQTLLFREQELEDKLSAEGLTEMEQQLYQDIITIKDFLATFGSQLTPWGIEVITKATQPGSFSILFRNDHFSLLYRHPQTMELLTLVTDFGYYKYDEVVWQSLLDVNDVKTEFFSGDFRLVGGPQQESQPDNNVPGAWYEETGESSNANNGGGGEWQTVQGRRSKNNVAEAASPHALSPKHEQEDLDLALALQLQEEEEERHRAQQEARRRESQLSEQFIEQQGRGTGNTARTGPMGRGRGTSSNASSLSGRRGRGGSSSSLVPPRGNSANVAVTIGSTNGRGRPAQQVRPLVPPVNTTHRPSRDGDDDDAPPSYEQASKTTPYHPPEGHPSHPGSTPGASASASASAAGGSRRRTSGPAGNAGPQMPGRPGRVQPVPQAAASGGGGRDKDCTVM